MLAYNDQHYHIELDSEDDSHSDGLSSDGVGPAGMPTGQVVAMQVPVQMSGSMPSTAMSGVSAATGASGRSASAQLISQWSRERCAEFISSIGLGQYCSIFLDQEIFGESLINLNHPDLREMGISSIGHRLIILKNIYEMKVKHNIPIDPDNFVPPSVEMEAQDQPASQDDITRLIKILKERDERLAKTESEIIHLRDELIRLSTENKKLRHDIAPLSRMAEKANTDSQFARQPIPSLPHPESGYDHALGPRSLAGMRPTPTHSPSSLHHQPSPTSPAYPPMGRHNGSWTASDHGGTAITHVPADGHSPAGTASGTPTSAAGMSGTGGAAGSAGSNSVSSATSEIFKSFRVSIDDPCHKVLPLALKRYNITDDWRQYALYIVYGNESKRVERCLRLNEKPLTLFKQLDKEGQKPMFMLRKMNGSGDGKSPSAHGD